MIKVALIGCGYWGPNLIRNFVACPATNLQWACDLDEERLSKVLRPYPGVRQTTDMNKLLADNDIDAVAIATPVHSHYKIGKAVLEADKHVLIEKPLASSVDEGLELVELAKSNGLQIMVDHTFCYNSAVLKIKEIIDAGTLGEVFYFDSVRINLGLFQNDINVVWDLAPHDLSILDFIIGKTPNHLSATGVCHAGNDIENIAYLSLGYSNSFMAHFHLNWLSPVKIRRTIICGSEKMLVWDDLEPAEKIKIYDKGIEVENDGRKQKERLMVSYRSGDMYAPHVDGTEALSLMVKEFAECITQKRPAHTDGEAGLRVLRVLEAADHSIKNGGMTVQVRHE